jgi:cytochrome c peroxidase
MIPSTTATATVPAFTHTGLPSYIRASLREASRGGSNGYEIAGFQLGSHLGGESPYEADEDEWAEAIAVFDASLITPNAPFDKFLNGDASALTSTQKQGLRLFIEKGCATCHNGINVGGGMYSPFGVVENPGAELLPPGDKGRFSVTKSASDEYVFKVPTLRNIALTAPYFHTGRAWDLRQATAVMGVSQLGALLTADETEKVAVFLESLTGDQPRIMHPILPPSVAATPRPQR